MAQIPSNAPVDPIETEDTRHKGCSVLRGQNSQIIWNFYLSHIFQSESGLAESLE